MKRAGNGALNFARHSLGEVESSASSGYGGRKVMPSKRETAQRYVPCGAQRRWEKGEAHWILGTKEAHKRMDFQGDRK